MPYSERKWCDTNVGYLNVTASVGVRRSLQTFQKEVAQVVEY